VVVTGAVVEGGLAARASAVMPGGVSSPARSLRAVGDAPLFIARGAGARVYDEDGGELVDYIGSWGAAIVGHAHPMVVEAVERRARDGFGYGASAREEVELAEEIVDRVPSIDRVRFVSSGTEAVMSAVRLARAATGRDVIVKFAGCYHGHADAMLAAAGSGLATLGIPSSPGVPRGAARDTVTLLYNDADAARSAFAEHGDRIAGVIVEAVAGNMGVVPATSACLRTLRELTDSSGALLIFDEVMTGFRTARGGAQEWLGIAPDLTTLGKVVGGGLPLAAYGGRTDLMDLVAPSGPVYQAGTLSGNPIAATAGLATLRLLDDHAYARLERSSTRLADGIERALRETWTSGCVQRVGSMLSVFFGLSRASRLEDVQRADHARFAALFRALRRDGVLIPPSGFESWFISTAHTETDIDETAGAVRAALASIKGNVGAVGAPGDTGEPSDE